MLPFELPPITRGYAEITRQAAAVGVRAASVAAAGLGERLGLDVRLSGSALPGRGAPGAGCARLAFDLSALPGSAALEVDAALVARAVDLLAGGDGGVPGASAPTPAEASMLDLMALAALEALARDEEIERALSPRLCRSGAEPESPLAVALDVTIGAARGRGRLLLPPAAARAFRGRAELPGTLASVALTGSLRSGHSRATDDDLASLAGGDVLLLDEAPSAAGCLVVAGGPRASGRIEDDAFHVEEMPMTDHAAAATLTLEVELARFPITLAELSRLEPGAALPIPVGRRGLVTLRLGERAVAQGELVDIDGAVGVRVLSLGE
jgi:type III secretion system YscQ/HrcQ family protein